MNKLNATIRSIPAVSINQQQGVVIIMALVILLGLTLLGVSSMRTTSMQERMSGNARDYQTAFEAAELCLRAGEDYIKSIVLKSDFNNSGTGGKFQSRDLTESDAWRTEANWTDTTTTSVAVANTSKNPQYMIQLVDSDYGQVDNPELTGEGGAGGSGTISLFRITCRGYGKSPNTRVMLQSDFGKLMSN